jgi:hypothetical protein
LLIKRGARRQCEFTVDDFDDILDLIAVCAFPNALLAQRDV